MRGFHYKKAIQSLNYFATMGGGSINKMKAIKLVWLSDRLHLRNYGRLITGDEYYALPNGPIPSATRDILENNNFIDDLSTEYASHYICIIDRYNFKSIADCDLKVFSNTDKEMLKTIFLKFGDKDHFELSDISHKFPEWKKFESALTKKLSSRFLINKEDFFINTNEPSGLFIDTDESISISRQIYDQNSKLLSVF